MIPTWQKPKTAAPLALAWLVSVLSLAACQEPGTAGNAQRTDAPPPDGQVETTAEATQELLAESSSDTEPASTPSDGTEASLAGPAGEGVSMPDPVPVAEPADTPTETVAEPEAVAAATPEPEPAATETAQADPAPSRTLQEPAAVPEPTMAAQAEPEPAAEEPPVEAQPPTPVASTDSEPEPAPQSAPAAPTLDLDGLEDRLRKTKAIGVFTKLELKNQVEDLLEEVDDYHRNKGKLSLAQLEERFDLLVMKLLLLLQDGDPPLHQLIADARPALWTTLADPDQFANVKGT